ncbi:MAG TPA: hypothetical protein VHG08_09165 [Longimicrobium sp.]|nr:hypothetical protein [Longimicrobium sp.]
MAAERSGGARGRPTEVTVVAVLAIITGILNLLSAVLIGSMVLNLAIFAYLLTPSERRPRTRSARPEPRSGSPATDGRRA